MLTGERRPASIRRGMTVLGKIPAVPKPINLPSQRLENRGLDPNVEIVPRGSVGWGTAGRSPPTSAAPWGNSTQSSSPPVSSAPWAGVPPRPATAGSSGPASGGVPWGGNAPRPSSAGTGTRPSSAGSVRQTQEAVAAASAWGPPTTRPASASGVLGQAQAQPPAARPRTAETRNPSTQAPPLTRFAEQTNGPPAAPPPPAWGGAGTARKLAEEPHQPARFTLTRGDFPTLGSEKNPDLRPQQSKSGSSPPERSSSVDERITPPEERPPSGPSGPYEEMPPSSAGAYGGQERMPEGWRRDPGPYGGHSGMEGNWHRDGPPPMQPYGGGQQVADTWRREPGHGGAPGGGPSDDNWRRGGPPVGPYGPPGPGRFQPDPSGFMHQQRYGPGLGPGPYGRGGGPGPGGYSRPGDNMFASPAPFGRPGGGAPQRPGPPMGPGMYQGPGPYDNYYGPPGPGYGNMDDREMMMLGMGGPQGMYGNYPQGPPVEPYGRYSHGGPGPGPGPGPRHLQNSTGMNRERGENINYEGEGYRDGVKYKDNSNFKDGGGYKDGVSYNKEAGPYKEGGRPISHQDSGDIRRMGHVMSTTTTSDTQRPSSRGGGHGGHRDWGAADSNDEPMDFSKPVFEEDITSASPVRSNKQSPSVDGDVTHAGSESKPVEHSKVQDPTGDLAFQVEKMKGLTVGEETKDSLVVQVPKSKEVDKDAETQKHREVDSGSSVLKGRVGEVSLPETRDPVVKKVAALESSESSEKRWGKDLRMSTQTARERGFGREPIFSPHGGRPLIKKESSPSTGSVTPTMRPSSAGVNSRLAAVSVTQGPVSSPVPELVAEEVVSLSVQEKSTHPNSNASFPTSPSESDSQKNSERLRILKRLEEGGPESPLSDTVNITEMSHAEALVTPVSVMEPVKDDTKPKGKPTNSHDGEKEWRPKVHIADMGGETPPSVSVGPTKQSTPPVLSVTASAAAQAASDKAVGPDSGNSTNVDSYNYEAQRARMKEIAAQRAIQLRKEEEERIKEQRAKALAKLEELNRRSLVVSVPQPVEPALDETPEESVSVIVEPPETEVCLSEVVVEDVEVVETARAGAGVSTPRGGVRNGRNEHGKRERVGDRKGNGRSREEHRVKMGSGDHRELAKGKLGTSLSQGKMEPPVLPPLSQQSGAPQGLLPSPSTTHATNSVQHPESPVAVLVETSASAATTHVQQRMSSKLQDSRNRGKPYVSQLKPVVGRQAQSPVELDQPASAQEVTSDSAEKSQGWPLGINAPLDLDSKDVSLSLGSGVVSSETSSTFRKKKMKNSARNKQKPEGLTVSIDSTLTADPSNGWNIDASLPEDSVTEMGKVASQAPVQNFDDAVKVVPSPVSQNDIVPLDSKPESGAAEVHGTLEIAGADGVPFRANGDFPSKRLQRKSQPVRRVPLKDRGTSQDVRVGEKPHVNEGLVWAPVRSPSGAPPAGPKGGFGSDSLGSGDYTGEKKEEAVTTPQAGRARRAELERYTPKPVVKQQAQQQEEVQQQQQEEAVPSVSQPQGGEAINVSVSNDALQSSSAVPEIKFGGEPRQFDNSVKGRGHPSWRQRALGGERASGPKDSHHQVQHGSVDTGGKFQQPSYNSQASQNYHRNRPQTTTLSEQARPGSSHQARSDVAAFARHPPSPVVSEKEQQNMEVTQQGHSSMPASTPAVIEKEQKVLQEVVTPYQPPRPGSSQKNRASESDGQNSHEQGRPHRVNAVHVDRQHPAPGKFEREHHGSHERGGHQQPRSQNFRHSSSHDRDVSHQHQQSRPAPTVQPGPSEGPSIPRERDLQMLHTVAPNQAKSGPQSVPGQNVAPVSTDREQAHVELVGPNQSGKSSPVRQRTRHHGVSHEREQTAPGPHPHQIPRYRQSVHEREHQRDVSNATHHQQQQRVTSDGHWQQTGSVLPERVQPNLDLGQSHEHSTRPTPHKAQALPAISVERDRALAHSGPHDVSRLDSQSKPQTPSTNDPRKQPQYQPVSQHQKPQQQSVARGPNVENTLNNSRWNGERGGGSPYRGRDHGHSRRGRFGGRASGVGLGRSGDFENRREQREQPPKQRLPIDATGGAVASQVGG